MANQTSMTPTTKVTVGVVAGAATAIILELVEKFSQVTFTPGFAVAISTVLSFIVSYVVPNADTDSPPAPGEE